MLQSIQKIHKVYQTGQKPVLVTCSDLEDYVCKHNLGHFPCKTLFAEYLTHHLLEALDVQLSKFEFVEVKEEHIVANSICQPIYFRNIPCFGTLYLSEAIEFSKFPLQKKEVKKINNLEDLLTIAFCDIWLANEDRNWNNFNMMINPVQKGWDIIPIDHGACFNSLGFSSERRLYSIDYNASIIETEQFRTLARKLFRSKKDIGNHAERLYICVQELADDYETIVQNIPESWGVPKDYIEALHSNLFDNSWLNETKYQFASFIKSSFQFK